MEHHGVSPAKAAISLVAAGLGLLAGGDMSIEHTIASISPEEFAAWTRVLSNALFTIVNTLVGCYHLVAIGHRTVVRRRQRATPPDGRAPHTDPAGGGQIAGPSDA